MSLPRHDAIGVGDPMTSYDIQFQKGLSLREFNAAYATEEQCREAICKARWGDGFVCPECGSTGTAPSPGACSGLGFCTAHMARESA